MVRPSCNFSVRAHAKGARRTVPTRRDERLQLLSHVSRKYIKQTEGYNSPIYSSQEMCPLALHAIVQELAYVMFTQHNFTPQ